MFIIFIGNAVFADIPARKYNNLPQGTFKKKRNGTIIQYNNQGKKIGEYKLNSGRLYRVK